MLGAPAQAAETSGADDPYVLLDAAKLKLGDGRLTKAREMLAEIPLENTQAYVTEEIILQRLLINGAYLKATHYLLTQLERFELGDSAYAQWLADERETYASAFTMLAQRYLDSTAGGPRMDFVRFNLPLVTIDHLNDLELYSDPEILGPAVTNWDDGRQGLGKGLIAGQARVALVLSAARYYDMPEAAASLEQVSRRLESGVPLDYAVVLEWLAEEAAQAPDVASLGTIRDEASARLVALQAGLGTQPQMGAGGQNSTGLEPSE